MRTLLININIVLKDARHRVCASKKAKIQVKFHFISLYLLLIIFDIYSLSSSSSQLSSSASLPDSSLLLSALLLAASNLTRI